MQILSRAKIHESTHTQIENPRDSSPQLELVFELCIPTPADPK